MYTPEQSHLVSCRLECNIPHEIIVHNDEGRIKCKDFKELLLFVIVKNAHLNTFVNIEPKQLLQKSLI